MKYKVGDVVKVKSLEWYNENKDERGYVRSANSTATFVECMSKYCGKEATIVDVSDNHYKLDIDHIAWSWTDEMFEGVVPNPEDKTDELPSMVKDITLDKKDKKIVIAFANGKTIDVDMGICFGQEDDEEEGIEEESDDSTQDESSDEIDWEERRFTLINTVANGVLSNPNTRVVNEDSVDTIFLVTDKIIERLKNDTRG